MTFTSIFPPVDSQLLPSYLDNNATVLDNFDHFYGCELANHVNEDWFHKLHETMAVLGLGCMLLTGVLQSIFGIEVCD